MSLDELRADLARNAKAASAITTPAEVVNYLQGTLWPFLEGVIDQLADHDESILDLIEEADDILQPETAAVISAALTSGAAIAAELKRRLDLEPDSPDKMKWMGLLGAFAKGFTESCTIIKDITIVTDFDEEETEDDDGEDAEDEDESTEGDE